MPGIGGLQGCAAAPYGPGRLLIGDGRAPELTGLYQALSTTPGLGDDVLAIAVNRPVPGERGARTPWQASSADLPGAELAQLIDLAQAQHPELAHPGQGTAGPAAILLATPEPISAEHAQLIADHFQKPVITHTGTLRADNRQLVLDDGQWMISAPRRVDLEPLPRYTLNDLQDLPRAIAATTRQPRATPLPPPRPGVTVDDTSQRRVIRIEDPDYPLPPLGLTPEDGQVLVQIGSWPHVEPRFIGAGTVWQLALLLAQHLPPVAQAGEIVLVADGLFDGLDLVGPLLANYTGRRVVTATRQVFGSPTAR